MKRYFNRSKQLKRYASTVLVMFVVSIFNMSMQIPAHAAMQSSQHQGMAMSDTSGMMDHSSMQKMDMQDCGCPPALCDSVDAQQDQVNQQSSSNASINDLLEFYPISFDVQIDKLHLLANVSFQYHDWRYRQHTPPPLRSTSTLLI